MRTPRQRECTSDQRTHGMHQKGNRTELAERTDPLEWRTSTRGQRTPGRGNPQLAPRVTRGRESKGGGATRSGTGPAGLSC